MGLNDLLSITVPEFFGALQRWLVVLGGSVTGEYSGESGSPFCP
jgi:hypothetical protein